MREMKGTALIVNGTADHIHMLVRIRPAHSAAEVTRVIKANSSKWVHQKWTHNFSWQTGYAVFSVSEPTTRNIFGNSFFRPFGAREEFHAYPRLRRGLHSCVALRRLPPFAYVPVRELSPLKPKEGLHGAPGEELFASICVNNKGIFRAQYIRALSPNPTRSYAAVSCAFLL